MVVLLLIICPYVRVHPQTKRALSKFDVEYICTSDSEFAYWELLSECWDTDEDLVIVEQDIVVTPKVIPSFLACPRGWCTYAYFVQNHYGQSRLRSLSSDSLGCVKISAQFRRKLPQSFVEKTSWTKLDIAVRNFLTFYGGGEGAINISDIGRPHCHGTVQHLNKEVIHGS
jgi:hypothetical protein